MHQLFDLTGQVALVTGASRGIGQAIAVGLAEAGATIVGVARSDQSETARQVQAAGQRFEGIEADLSQPSTAEQVFDEALARTGRVDILVNNAGIIRRKPAIDVTDEEWDEVLHLNLTQVFRLSRRAAAPFPGAGPGEDHHDRLLALLPGRHPGPRLHGQQERPLGPHPGPGQRVGAFGHQRQRHRARLRGL